MNQPTDHDRAPLADPEDSAARPFDGPIVEPDRSGRHAAHSASPPVPPDRALDRRILAVAGPAIGGYLGMILFDVANIFWVGKLGVAAVAGVASAGFIVWTMFAVMQTTLAGCNALVAQYHGAGRRAEAHAVVVEATWASLAITAMLIAVLLPAYPHAFRLMGLDAAATAQASAYFHWLILSLPVNYLYALAGIVFNAYGDTRSANLSLGVALLLNLGLDPLLIFGWAGLPALGVQGAAVATLVSQCCGLVLRVAWLRRAELIGPLATFRHPGTRHLGRIAGIGLPNALTAGVWSLVYPLLTRLITPFGMAPLSAIGICFRIESFPYFAGMGLNIAMATLVGQAVGRGDAVEAAAVVRRGLWLATLLVAPFAALFVLLPGHLVGLLTDDAATIAHGGAYLFAIGCCEIFLGWELLFGGVFTGLGRTRPTLAVCLPLTLARVPLGWALGHAAGWGPTGVWWAISLSTLGKGVGLALLYRHRGVGWAPRPDPR